MINFIYNMRLMICWSICLALPQLAWTISGRYPIQNFTPAQYKAGIQNIDFAQNRDMTLFVANNLGVLSFNGNVWQTHDFRTGKKKRSLAFDEVTDRLYVGSQGEFGFFADDWQYVSLVDQIPDNARDFDEVWDVFLQEGKVYFCTFQGIYVYDGDTITVIGKQGGLERSFLANGKIFTQSQQGRLLEMIGSELVSTYPQEQTGQIIAGVIPHKEGYLLVYNSGRIEWTTPFGVSRQFDDLARVLQGTYVNHVMQLSDNRLAIATQTSGLFLYDLQNRVLEMIDTEHGLGTNACLRTFQDYFGNLWVGMQNGIALIQINSPMRLLSREINIEGSGYEAYETVSGAYYTSSNGIYFLPRGASHCVFLPGSEGPAYGIQEIAGRLYAGHHSGLFLLEKEQAIRIATTDGLWQLKQLRSQPEYAIGGTYSGLYLFRLTKDGRLQPVQKIQGFSASSRFLEEDRLGNIWVGQYYKGLYQLKLSPDLTKVTIRNVSQESDLPIQEQIVLSRISDDLFLATNTGLYQLDPIGVSVKNDNVFSAQIGEHPVYLLAQDQKNHVHLLAEDQVGFFKQISAGNYLFVPSSLYQLRYHLNNDLLHISTHTEHGVFFSANEGFIHYDPELEATLKLEKPLVINRVYNVAQERTLYLHKPFAAKPEAITPLEINAGAKVLKIEVESFQFDDPGNLQFRYLLRGLDEDFGEWTTAAVKEYTNLREGDYEFIVQTRNYLGETATGTTLFITVRPPFYWSFPARVLYAFLAFGLLFLLFRLQKRRYRRKAEKIESASRLERAAEQQKLQEIEQQKEQELLRLKEEKMQSEVQHLGKLLAASTMNLVVKNEFIEAIKDELKEVKQKGRNPETKRALEKIVKEIDITLKVQEDWEQFEFQFDAVHGDFLTRLRQNYPDLSPNEQKLCAFLRLNLNTKEITNLLGISIRGVEVARYRLRRKLGLDQGQNLAKFILEY